MYVELLGVSYIPVYVFMSNFWMVEESLLKGMGGSLTCRRRSRAEPLEEPEPAASGDSSPVSESFHFETSSTHLLVETTVVAAEPPSATSPSEETIFRVSNAVGSLEAPTGVNWSDPKVDFRIYAVWIVPRGRPSRVVGLDYIGAAAQLFIQH